MTLKCPFDGLTCKRSGDCCSFCKECRMIHPKCSRFDIEKFNSDASIRRGFRLIS